ncbi:polysaccharide deacetylase family protein [Lachnospiraceae bacterium NSJ-29]|uniref:Polysaccharide deacetylase family protein n=2 Tax=Wansuia hejianensis TaxID=2763667 RepID=A0A926F3J0_9FIRM|nr:polysaccharide deacetylase family protein [Wansuia hejianensis]MBC8591295.1 polysaccharide deacetylase family protein [Wansuia hejianensis]
MTMVLSLMTISISKNYSVINAFSPTKELPIYSVERNDNKIAISFDAAYGDEYTLDILDTLDKYNVKSTFFLVKFWVEKFPHRVEEIHKRGHEIGNHSATHPNMSTLSRENMAKELNDTGDLIYEITKEKPILFRPPYGDYNDTVIEVARENGYHTIQWDIDSLDWKELGVQPVVDRVVRNVSSGSIVLFHNNAKYISEYLPLVIEKLQEEGYEIVPVSELIHYEDYKIDNNGRQIPNK